MGPEDLRDKIDQKLALLLTAIPRMGVSQIAETRKAVESARERVNMLKESIERDNHNVLS